ncbi:hypothetical protein C1645_879254 [Glomus cerebriforme]|uniref:Uncharacterized protein n=1 Tax=Glomus cerebriforme TaxID=658196 RepID=A0A397SHK1_9GLOM|nr:hypothetical protein C1645_879254 [Glomus cerebriforme]
MLFFLIFFISFLCPFVLAQESNDVLFSNYIDILLNFISLSLIYIIVIYDAGSTSAHFIRSLIFFVNLGLQEELAFMISPVKIPYYIIWLQHIVIVLMEVEVIINFIKFIFSSDDEGRFISKFENFENWVNLKIVELENKLKDELESRIKSKFEHLKKDFNTKFDNLRKDFDTEFDNLKKDFKTKIDNLEKQVYTKLNNLEKEIVDQLHELEEGIRSKFVNFENRIQNLEQKLKLTQETGVPFARKLRPRSNAYILDRMSNTYLVRLETMDLTHYKNCKEVELRLLSYNHYPKIDNLKLLLIRIEYIALILFIFILYFLLNELKENITPNFIKSLVITSSLAFLIQFTILIVSHRRRDLQNYIKWYQEDCFTFEICAYINLIVELFVHTTVLYLPSLINCFLLQTSDIFNKIFLNLSILSATACTIHLYKVIKREGDKEKGKKKKNSTF